MCNQTEMYREIYEYDRKADIGEVHVRGIAHDPKTCLKCKKEAELKKKKKKNK